MTQLMNTASPVAVWYRRLPREQTARPDVDRDAAYGIAHRLGVAIACEIEVVGAAQSPAATAAWASAKREAEAIGASTLIVLTPAEIALDLPTYVLEIDALAAKGIRVQHQDGTRDWYGNVNDLVRAFLASRRTPQARERIDETA